MTTYFDGTAIEREYAPGDLPYIMSTWLRELHSEYPGPLPDNLWFDSHRQFIEALLGDKRVMVKVLAAADRPSEILAYAVAIPSEVLIWIHVRPRFRQHGLALLLLRLTSSLESPLMFLTKLARLRLKNLPRGRAFRTILARQPTMESSVMNSDA